MRPALPLLSLAALAVAGDAPPIHSNPPGVTYTARIPEVGNDITGTVKAAGAPNGEGTSFQVVFYNLPVKNFTYGIYNGSVGLSQNCSLAGPLLNPYNGVTGRRCSTKDPAACAIGDLSTKEGGALAHFGGSGTGYYAATFIDQYLSLTSTSESFLGNGSIVLKSTNGTSLACAAFNRDLRPVPQKSGLPGPGHTIAGGPISSTTSSPTTSAKSTSTTVRESPVAESTTPSSSSSAPVSNNHAAAPTAGFANAALGGGLVGLAALLL